MMWKIFGTCVASSRLFSGGRKQGTSVPTKSQFTMCVDFLRKIPLVDWFFCGEKQGDAALALDFR